MERIMRNSEKPHFPDEVFKGKGYNRNNKNGG